MTRQIKDYILFKDNNMEISAIESESSLFEITGYGISPNGTSSACWRGHMEQYYIDECDNLILKDLIVNYPAHEIPIELHGIKGLPLKRDHRKRDPNSLMKSVGLIAGNTLYENLNIPVCFSGKLIGCDDYIYSGYDNMGFSEPYKYKIVMEFVFEKGICIKINDLSDIAEEKRNKGHAGIRHDKNYVNKMFSLKYEDKWD